MTADGWISLLTVAGMLITDGFFVWVALRLAPPIGVYDRSGSRFWKGEKTKARIGREKRRGRGARRLGRRRPMPAT